MCKQTKPVRRPFGRITTPLLALPMALLLAVLLSQGDPACFMEPDRKFAYAAVWILDMWLFYKMLRTGKTDRYRAVLFIAFALALSVTFISRMFEARGAMTFNHADLLQCEVPFCHIVTTMILIPAALSDSIIFPGRIEGGFADISSMLVIVFGALLIMGRGFCSWGCFYGGWDDAFSRLSKRKRWKNPPASLRWGGFALLLLVAVTSASMLSPTYCDWICPFKAVTEYEAVESVEAGLKAIIFISLFLVLVIVLPIVTQKRTQCAWFCPMGAFCSSTGKVLSPYQVRIRTDTCLKCGKCIRVCPMGALDKDSLETGKATMGCSLCGKCVDVCPNGSISYHVRYSGKANKPTLSRLLFLYSGFLFLAVFSGGSLQQFILLLLRGVARLTIQS
ncbi:MAG: 4Fe-4S binding protein [Opitutales bacterium]|nr:4Fe-4S binding protein [Opitutales bacterium]